MKTKLALICSLIGLAGCAHGTRTPANFNGDKFDSENEYSQQMSVLKPTFQEAQAAFLEDCGGMLQEWKRLHPKDENIQNMILVGFDKVRFRANEMALRNDELVSMVGSCVYNFPVKNNR